MIVGEGERNPAWRDALARFDRQLAARGMAEKTRRAYGRDVGELAAWATDAGIAPEQVDYRFLRRYAARLGGGAGDGARRALSPPTIARKFASIRAFFRQMVERGELEHNPADLVSHARRRAPLPKALRTDEVEQLLDRTPVHTPLEARDRAMLELLYSCGLRCEEVVNVDIGDVDFDGEELRVLGKGSKTRIVPVGEPAQRALERYLGTARPALLQAPDEPAMFLSKRGRRLSPSDVRRRLADVAAPRGPVRGRLPACPAALLCHSSARRRGGSTRHPGAFGPCERLYDPDLHSGRVSPPAPPVQS